MARQQFEFPFFWSFPPYFTLQPVEETRRKQVALWCELILRWCKHHQVYKLSTDVAEDTALFANQQINRSLNGETRTLLLQVLVKNGNGMWLSKSQSQCLILWKKLPEWAAALHEWALSIGMQDAVTSIEEIMDGEDSVGTDFAGMPKELLLEAVKILEQQRKAKLFKGTSADDIGIKFFA